MAQKSHGSITHMRKIHIFSVLLLVVAAILLCIYFYQQYRIDLAEQQYEQMRQEKDTKTPKASPQHDFAALHEMNPEIYAWVNVPGTVVDYPVLQSQEDNYYLTHDSNHAESVSGAIYSNACNSVDMSDRITILYGHDMRADTMFGSLHLFDEEEFFEQHTVMSVETAQAYYTYEIIGVYNYNDDYLPSQFDVKTEAGMYAFADALAECQAQGSSITHVREGVQITSDDRLLVLSTCIASQSDRRFLVVGRLISTIDYEL